MAVTMNASFVHGCNYPWSTDGSTVFYGLDFGANVWGSHVGVSTRRGAIARDFAQMAALGFTVVRWFVFCDGRSGIVFDERGVPVGLDAFAVVDLDVALEVAREVGIALVLVLLDHSLMFSGRVATFADAASGAAVEVRLPDGRAPVLLSDAAADALFTRVIAPIVRRYGPRGARADLASTVFAYELMNEPDFVVEEWEQDLSAQVTRPIPFARLADHVSRLSAIVHSDSLASTTIAAARVRNLWAWDDAGLGLDWLQIHTYPDTSRPELDEDIYGRSAATLGVSRPIVIGECPGDGPNAHPPGVIPPPWTLGNYLDFATSNGYAGAWGWSFSGTDHYGPLPSEPLRTFAQRYPGLVNRTRSGPIP